VKISKEEQIRMRRDTVLELRAQGLTQQEIANKLSVFGVSRRTIGNDLEYLRKNAVSIIRAHQQNIAFEYQQILSNFYQLRKDAWARFNDPRTKNHDRMMLYQILENLNHDILEAFAIGDMIEQEALEAMKEDVSEMQKAMDKMMTKSNENEKKDEQAVF
jgi:DNA-binding transcriptional regulator LsrR (DeoR family)